MRKADLVLLVLVVLAVVATAAGGLSGDRWTQERTVRFSSHSLTLAAQPAAPATGQGARFNWTVPDNSTSASLAVDLAFQGQAVRGGMAVVTLRVVTPDGKAQPAVTKAWSISPSSTASTEKANATVTWSWVPASIRDTSSGAHGHAWAQPLQLLVVVEPPADLPLATYRFTGAAQGQLSYYTES